MIDNLVKLLDLKLYKKYRKTVTIHNIYNSYTIIVCFLNNFRK
jgi:hypothetical protein